jgi:hypothetical protein
MKYLLAILLIGTFYVNGTAQNAGESRFTIGRVHYRGGGDWYGNKTSLVNMLRNFSKVSGLPVANKEVVVKLDDPYFFNYPLLYLAGHGNVVFSEREAFLLREYLINGGFLYADDDYGMDKYFRAEMKKVFPELDFVEVPFNDPLFSQPFSFPGGAPKIHEHHGGPPEVLGLYYNGRLVTLYTYNTDISDGCEDEGIHDDPAEKRAMALRFSANILFRALTE